MAEIAVRDVTRSSHSDLLTFDNFIFLVYSVCVGVDALLCQAEGIMIAQWSQQTQLFMVSYAAVNESDISVC